MLSYGRWKMTLVILVSLAGLIFTIPNAFRDRAAEWPNWFQPITLGLDLQGGSYLLLQVEYQELMKEHLNSLLDEARTGLRKERIPYTGLKVDGDAVVLKIPSEEERPRALRLLRGQAASAGALLTSGEDGQVRIQFSPEEIENQRTWAIEQSIDIVRRRVDETGTREPTIQRQGADRIIVELPGIDDPERVKALIGKTAKLTFHLLDTSVTEEDLANRRVPYGSMILPNAEAGRAGEVPWYAVKKAVQLTGDHLIKAGIEYDKGAPAVSFQFDTVGGRKFGQVTTDNGGGFLAIVLDGKVISAPRIREPITGGRGIITGTFTSQEAADLALLLRAGALPAPLTPIEERTVGPGLGQDSIDAGKLASVLGACAVFVFMVVCYGLFGLFASLALMVNIVLLLGLLGAIGATLTLPGIAGIALTIGMAVDANVLIFERIREEAMGGRTPVNAVETGFTNAFSAIFDANITTLFAAMLLYYFGTGPVRGFAVTLALGVLTSMFTAIMVTHAIIHVWLRRARPKTIPL
ncbi:protein translocase subunit SecD [Phaeovibrio sulfidiphilus]|uniref:Protein translocase subunit SecD n=1 Tax=Phaeovibrio sulfidiphilus TaxID=1220600 RepID=A0A8J7CPC6_9PROT|nr:protein translocase subunit SecD [Phaeovibrio sulfidiphilus]MBE1236887.1 protein translocase subunit SecD [Phaeovibrio sulfidiphilus]